MIDFEWKIFTRTLIYKNHKSMRTNEQVMVIEKWKSCNISNYTEICVDMWIDGKLD